MVLVVFEGLNSEDRPEIVINWMFVRNRVLAPDLTVTVLLTPLFFFCTDSVHLLNGDCVWSSTPPFSAAMATWQEL